MAKAEPAQHCHGYLIATGNQGENESERCLLSDFSYELQSVDGLVVMSFFK